MDSSCRRARDAVSKHAIDVYYEQAFLGVESYLQDTLQPWLEGCMAANLESMRMKQNGIDTPQLKETIELGASWVKILGAYNSALRRVAFSHSRHIPFSNLDRRTLLALLDALTFRFILLIGSLGGLATFLPKAPPALRVYEQHLDSASRRNATWTDILLMPSSAGGGWQRSQ